MSKNEMITLPREVVKRVMDALYYTATKKSKHPNQWMEEDAAMKELRAALEQPQNHVPDFGNMVQAGWKLVPVEPTEEMLRAGTDAHYEAEKRIQDQDAWSPGGFAKRAVRAAHVFRAMLAAAPQPPAPGRVQADPAPYLYYDPNNGDTWTQEAINDGCCLPDGLIALYTK